MSTSGIICKNNIPLSFQFPNSIVTPQDRRFVLFRIIPHPPTQSQHTTNPRRPSMRRGGFSGDHGRARWSGGAGAGGDRTGWSGGAGAGGGRGSGGAGAGVDRGRYSNPCLTMHQPWASLLVHGIKRIEGRSWPSPITGRLWIHAASKVPDPETIRAMEDFYRQIYAVDGITNIKFPEHYPVSRLLGCVEVVGCIRSDELACCEAVPQSVRLEALTEFCWLCEDPQRLVIPFEMRGYQGVYNLERRIYDAAIRGLSPVRGPLLVKFPLPNRNDPFSLKPGSLTFGFSKSTVEKTPSITAAIAGARAAATQFSRKDHTTSIGGESASPDQCSGGSEGHSTQGSQNPEPRRSLRLQSRASSR